MSIEEQESGTVTVLETRSERRAKKKAAKGPGAAPLVFRRKAAAREWSLSTERTTVFTVVRPNPDYEEWAAERVEDLEDGFELPDLENDPEAPPHEVSIDYTMPAKPNMGLALEYLRWARKDADTAASWLIETAIGEEGYSALVEELGEADTPEEAVETLRAVAQRISKVAMGGLEGKV